MGTPTQAQDESRAKKIIRNLLVLYNERLELFEPEDIAGWANMYPAYQEALSFIGYTEGQELLHEEKQTAQGSLETGT